MKAKEFLKLLNVNEIYKVPDKLLKKVLENDVDFLLKFKLECLEENDSENKCYFIKMFEEDYADRKNKKQDYTPNSIAKLLSKFTNNNAQVVYDVCSGTGSLILQKVYDNKINNSINKYLPSMYFYHCEELSDKAIPFLLLNLIERGVNAVVVQCDVLTRYCKNIYAIINEKNDFMYFSKIYIMPKNEEVAKEYNVKWVDENEI